MIYLLPQIAHKVQQLFLHLVKRLPQSPRIVYSNRYSFVAMNDTNGLKPATGQREVARRLPAASCPAATITGIKNNEPAKNRGNFHLSAMGWFYSPCFSSGGCDDSVALKCRAAAPAVSAADVVVKSISQWDSFNGRIEVVERFSCVRACPATLRK